MPLIPSHQGLLIPLWRRWPHKFNIVALCIGAGMPDAVDGAAGILINGHLGQWYGHTLWGAHIISVPAGLLLMAFTLFLARRFAQSQREKLNRIGDWVLSGHSLPEKANHFRQLIFVTISMWIGVLSHVIFDLLSHQNFDLLAPWYAGKSPIPDWWTTVWFTVSPPGYTDYPIGPHFIMWLFLSSLGLYWIMKIYKNK